MLFPKFCQLRRLVFDQSSPVQPVSESRGGTLSVTEEDDERTNERTKEILVSNIGYVKCGVSAAQIASKNEDALVQCAVYSVQCVAFSVHRTY